MAELRAPEQNRLLGQLANMLRATEGDIAAPEFLPRGLDVMGLVRQLMLPSAETVEKLSYGDPLFRMPTQSNIPITADREYLADIAGMIPFGAPAARPSARAMQELVRQIQTEPPTGAISPEIAARVLPDTKVVDEAGKPLVVYHGTPDAFESSIRGESYFSPDPEIAGIYTSPTASSIATFAKRGDAPAVYPSYLEIKKPFDTRDPKIRKEFMEEYYGKYGNMTPLSDSGLPDWTEARDLREWIEETGKNYDGLILDEGGIPMPDGTVKSRGISYVPFEASQIKSAVSDPQMAGLLDQPAQSVVKNPLQTAFTQVSPGDEVAGLTVREDVPNMGSIGASLDNYEVLSGIRRVPAKAFDAEYLDSLKARGLDKRTADLSEEIKQSKEINPLIVAVDSKGAYIIEGGHRFDALMTQGRDSVPAKVVIDQDDPPTEDFLRSLFD